MATAQIDIRADARQALGALGRVDRSLEDIQRQSKRTAASLRGIEGAASRVSTALVAAGVAFAGFAASRGISGILDATQKMEGFRSQLITYLGSQELANAELERLSKLARTLPQDIDQVTQAFVIFNRFGLDTSNESLRAFSNIAAANSKSIVQLGEAVADALTGEFERLKEFGIKVSKENGQFTARIGDQQVAVSNSTKDLVEQLKALGEEGGRFGNVTLPPLTTAMSNFRGAIFEASAALGEGGLGLAIADALNGITDLLTNNDKLVESFGDKLTKAFLYAKEAAFLVYQNIEILGKGIAILIGISVVKWVIGVASALAGPLVAAVVLATKAMKAFTLVLLRNPIIAAGAAVVAGIEYFTGAISDLGEELGLLGDDGVLDSLAQQATGLVDTISGGFTGAMDGVSNISARVEEQFANIKARAQETQTAMSEQEASAARTKAAAEAQAEAEKSKVAAFKELLDAKKEEYRVAQLSTEEQELYNLTKEFEKKLGDDITEIQKKELQQLVAKNAELKKAADRQKEIKSIVDDVYNSAVVGLDNQLKLLDEAQQAYKDMYGSNLEMEREFQERREELVRKANEKIAEIEMRRIEDTLRKQTSGLAQSLSAEQRAFLQKQGQNDKQKKIVADRIEFEKKSDAEKAQFAIQKGAEVFSALGAQNKKAFEAAKALNIANALMNTYAAATKALATYPWPFGLIAAAAAVAAGMAQVSAIRSQQYSGRSLGGPVLSNQSYIVGENGPELFTPSTSGNITRNSQMGGQAVNVNFNINAVDAAGVDDLLLERRGLITQMISDAMVERGQRSVV